MNDMEHVIKLCSKGQISVWKGDALKHIDPGETHQIQLLSRFLDHIICLKESTDGNIRLSPMIVSTPLIANTSQGNLPEYKLKCIIH